MEYMHIVIGNCPHVMRRYICSKGLSLIGKCIEIVKSFEELARYDMRHYKVHVMNDVKDAKDYKFIMEYIKRHNKVINQC